MSRQPYFFVERLDRHTKRYEFQHPIVWNYLHTEQEPADLYPYNGHHDLFSIVERQNDFPYMHGIHSGLPDGCCQEIQDAYTECSYELSWDNGNVHHEPTVRWFTYADMYLYCLEHPEVIDWNNEVNEPSSSKALMPNPVKSLMNRVDAFLEVMDGWDWRDDYSLIRIVYWID